MKKFKLYFCIIFTINMISGPENNLFAQHNRKDEINELNKLSFNNNFKIHQMKSALLDEKFDFSTSSTERWKNYDADADGRKWGILWGPGTGHGDNYCAASESYSWIDGTFTPDNWLVSPPLIVTSLNDSISYWRKASDYSYPAEHYALMVSTSTFNLNDFTNTLFQETLTVSDTAWIKKTFSLEQFIGDTIYVAFRHYNCSGQGMLELDDVEGPEVYIPELDARVWGITVTGEGCSFTTNESASVLIQNFGSTPVSNFYVRLRPVNGNTVSQLFQQTLNPGDTTSVSFAGNVDLSSISATGVEAWTELYGDEDNTNDTAFLNIEQNVALPYSTGFGPSYDFSGWSFPDNNWYLSAPGPNDNINFNSSDSVNHDWFFTRCFTLSASQTYRFSFDYRTYIGAENNKLKVFVGEENDSAAMLNEVFGMEYFLTANLNFNDTSFVFNVPTDGVYHFGFYSYGNPSSSSYSFFSLDNFEIGNATGIAETNNEGAEVKVYPNPARDNILLSSDSKIVLIEVYNTLGQMVISKSNHQADCDLDIHALREGIYYLKVETKAGAEMIKFIKAK